MALAAASNLLAALAAAGGGSGASPIGRRIGPPPGRRIGQQPQRHFPGHVPWGGQQFSDLPSLLAWIAAHGGNPQQTLATHPGLGAAFGQRGVQPGGGFGGAGGGAPGLGVSPFGSPGPPGLLGPPTPVHPHPGLLGPPMQVPPDMPAVPRPGGFGGGVLGGLRAMPTRRRLPRPRGQGFGVSPFGSY